MKPYKPTKTTLRNFGEQLLSWHSGGGSGVYAVGSHLFSGHAPDLTQVRRAFYELRKGDTPEELALAAKLQRYYPEAFEQFLR
jgi:hypothetical protein